MILVFMLLFARVWGQQAWRYSNQRSEKEFTTRDSISLDYYGQETVDWCFSSGCSLTEKSAKTALLHCEKPGIHPLSPIRIASRVRYINVAHSPFCYDWYLLHYKSANNQSTDGFRVWVVDPMHSSSEEKNMIAMVPSSFSAKLSTIFYKFGQEPTLSIKSGYRSIPVPLTVTSKGFDNNASYWDFETKDPIRTTQPVVWISGKSIAFHDCFIRDEQIQLLEPKYVFSFDNQSPQVQLTGGSQYPRVITDPCSPHIALYIGLNGLVITQDNFKSTTYMHVPSSLLEGKDPIVVDVGFAANGNMVFVLKSGSVIIYDRIIEEFTKATGLSGAISRLASVLTSFFDCSSDTKNSNLDVIAWLNTGSLFLSTDGGHQFLNIPWPFSSSWQIQEVVFHSFYRSYLFLASNATQPMVIEYSIEEKTWTQHYVTFTTFTEDDLSFTFLPKSSHFVLVWSTKTVFYGALNGEGSILQLKTRDATLSFTVDTATNISTICAGWAGEFVVVLNDGRMFYGKSDVSYIVEIYAGEPSSSEVSTMFDLAGRLVLITNSSNGIGRRLLPLRNEITSAMFPGIECPYIKLSSNVPPELQYLDKGETKSFWVSLIHQRVSSNAINHKFSSSQLCNVTVNEYLDFYPGMTMINKTFTFTKSDNAYSQNSTLGKGIMSVLFQPKTAGLTCKDTSQTVLLVKAGCRPSRHIRIRNCTSEAKDIKDFTDYHTIVQCELSGRVGKQMTLLLDMYDGNQKVMEIDRDYIIWEENNKDGFTYSATMAQAGCIREAQTWDNMTKTKNTSWHQDNYERCFNGDSGSVFDGSKPYEILNSTGISRVVFTQSGPFAFTFKVVDPSLSFCTLTGRFTVMVVPGEDSKSFIPEIIAMCVVILISFGLLCVSFWFYRRETLGVHEQDRQIAERLQQLRSIYKGVRMSVDQSTGGVRHSIRRSSGTAALLMGPDAKKSSQAGASLDTFIEEDED